MCSGRGNYIVIEHPINDGSGLSYYSVYEHLNSYSVASGATVSVGTQIGIAGNTGASLGTHLHYEILLLQSGLGSALSNTGTLDSYEKKGWVTKPNGGMGLLVTNPSTKNYEASSNCNMNDKVQWQSIPYHGGSVTYTFNKSEVSIGTTKQNSTSASYATLNQAASWVKSRINELATDMDKNSVCTDTDFIKEYSNFLGLETLNGTPASYINMSLPAGYTRIQNWTGADGFIPQKGDIGIWTGGTYGSNGHVGIILSADGWDIDEVAEITTSGSAGSTKISSRYNTYTNFWGVIRPVYSSSITKRYVSFKDYNGALLKSEYVVNGGSATAPSYPTRENYAFMGWNKALTNITNDVTIMPVYSLITTIQPTRLTSMSAALYGYDDIKLTWSKCNNVTGYAIYYKNNKNQTSYKLWKVTDGTSYNVPNLIDGAKYTFKVRPYRIIQGTVYWNTGLDISHYTLKQVSTPSVSKNSSSKIKISWGKVTGASGYQISRSTSKTGTTAIKNVSASYSNTTISTARNKTYYYKVRCYRTVNNKKIYGPWSSVKAYKLK